MLKEQFIQKIKGNMIIDDDEIFKDYLEVAAKSADDFFKKVLAGADLTPNEWMWMAYFCVLQVSAKAVNSEQDTSGMLRDINQIHLSVVIFMVDRLQEAEESLLEAIKKESAK